MTALPSIVAGILIALVASSATAQPQQFTMRCESRNYGYNFCASDGRVVSANVVRQRSSAPCILGRTWGWQGNGIWVSDGCEADFAVQGSVPNRPPPSNAGHVVCESREYRYNFCRVGRVRSAQLVQQRSRTPCIQGRTWECRSEGFRVSQCSEG